MMPSMTVAGNYAMVLHYLKAMEALGGNPHDGAKVVAKMKEMPTDDPLFGKGPLRADGRRLIPAYLFEVKKPEESKYPWDYYKLVATIAPERRRQAARGRATARCSRNSLNRSFPPFDQRGELSALVRVPVKTWSSRCKPLSIA